MAWLKRHLQLGHVMVVKAYAKTIVAESKLLTAIYNSGHVTDVTIMNRESDGVYTIRVETGALTTPFVLRKRIAKQLVNNSCFC